MFGEIIVWCFSDFCLLNCLNLSKTSIKFLPVSPFQLQNVTKYSVFTREEKSLRHLLSLKEEGQDHGGCHCVSYSASTRFHGKSADSWWHLGEVPFPPFLSSFPLYGMVYCSYLHRFICILFSCLHKASAVLSEATNFQGSFMLIL